jgi:DNA-binding transcriptional LysR family regulator
LHEIDWAKLQSFTAVAEHGSLSAAARILGASQPTLSRHIASLEEEIGVQLFDRTSTGLMLTATGAELYQHASQMREAATHLALIASGRSQELSGTVRITASETVALHALPAIIAAFRQLEPQIAIELVASNETENLLKREADIAVRMYRPTQNDVITRKVGVLKLGLYASLDYLQRRGEPGSADDLARHDFIGFDRADTFIEGFRAHGMTVDRDFFSLRTDAQFLHLELALAGCGLAMLHRDVGAAHASLRPVLPDLVAPDLPIWLTAHAELRTSPRVRRTYDFLAERLAQRYGEAAGLTKVST